jgi:oligopeptide transport system substrate-binding protein
MILMAGRRALRLLALISCVAVVCGCSRAGPHKGAVVLNRANGPDIKSLDPAYIDGQWEAFVVGDMLMGLTTEGPNGAPVPGAATHWTVSKDGLTWTFYLRDETWSDGVPVTAEDFVTAWRREVDPETAAVYSYNLWAVKNAKAITEGKLPPSALGISAPNDKTVVVRLEHPAAYLPELMDHQVAFPIPRHIYEKLGNRWARIGNYVGNGPYLPREWVPLDHITLVKNKRFYDAKHVQIDVVRYFVTNDSEAALKRYRGGEFDTLYFYPAVEINWMRHHIRDEIKTLPALLTYYLTPNLDNTLFQDKRLREVLNLAYDRENLVNNIRRMGEPAAYGIVPPGIAHYPHTAHMGFEDMPYAARVEKAKALMREMGYGPARRLRIDYLISTNPDTVRTAAALQGMYAPVWIDLNIIAEERQVQLVDMERGNFVLGASAWAADFNDASNYLDLLHTGSDQNYGHYSNPKFDALMDAAQAETDPRKRGELMSQAEQVALDDYAWVPEYFGVDQDLAKPYVKGWIANAKDFNRTRWLSVQGKPRR